MKLPNFRSPLHRVGEQNTKMSFEILPQKISPTFGKLNEIE